MQETLHGQASSDKLKRFFIDRGIKRILLLTGEKSYEKSTAKDFFAPALDGFEVMRLSGITENPNAKVLENCIQLFRQQKSQAILAVGGGSVIDTGKLIKAYAYSDENTIIESIKTNTTYAANDISLVAAPTTAGSGSESNHYDEVYVDGTKYSVSSHCLQPDVAILVPEFTYSMPPFLTAVSGIDAFAQSMESWWNINSTSVSTQNSKCALQLIWNNLLPAIRQNDKKARAKMLEAAYLAGKSINTTKTTAPHAFSYAFTADYGIPHGHAVALFLHGFAKINAAVKEDNCNDPRGVNWVKTVLGDISCILETEPDNIDIAILNFFNQCKIETKFSKLGVSFDAYKEEVGKVNRERLQNNPVKISPCQLYELYK